MKKALLILLFFCTVAFCVPVSAASGGAELVMEMSGRRILHDVNGERKLPMASLTKIMTALVVIENCDLEEKVKISAESTGVEGSSMYLKAGDVYTVRQLLYGLMLCSGNDAATALALYVGGDVDSFALRMNKRAAEIGLRNTNFVNPSGLDATQHYSTAYDLALLTATALDNETFAQIVATKQYTIGDKTLVNHNRLLWRLDGCIGVKTGYTRSCGRCLVSAIKKDGVTLICVTLNCSDDWNVHTKLYDKAIRRCRRVCVLRERELYHKIPVAGADDAGIYCNTIYAVEVDGNPLTIVERVPQFVYANKIIGEPVGTIEIYDGGEIVGSGKLYIDRDLRPKEVKKSIFKKLSDFVLHLFGF